MCANQVKLHNVIKCMFSIYFYFSVFVLTSRNSDMRRVNRGSVFGKVSISATLLLTAQVMIVFSMFKKIKLEYNFE